MAENTPGAITPESQPQPTPAPSAPVPATQPAVPQQPQQPQIATTPTSSPDDSQAKIAQLEAELRQSRDLQAQADKKAREERQKRVEIQRSARGANPINGGGSNPDDTSSTAGLEAAVIRHVYSHDKYRDVLAKDPTLASIFQRTPLALIQNPVDVEDAVYQVTELLEDKIASQPAVPSAPVAPATPTLATPATPAVPTPGVTNPPTATAAFNQHLENRNFDDAVVAKMADPSQWNKLPG